MVTSGLSRQRVGVAVGAGEVVGRRGDWRDSRRGGVGGTGRWWDHVGLGERGFGAVVEAAVARVGGEGGPRDRSCFVPARTGVRPVRASLVAAAAGGLQEPGGGEAQRQAARRDQPRLAAGKFLNVPEQPLSVGVTQVAAEGLGAVSHPLGQPCRGVPALTAELLGHIPYVLGGRVDLVAGLSRALVDLLAELAARLT